MRKYLWLLIPATLAAAVAARRLVPGALAGGDILLPSGWRIHPAGRQVTVGSLPLNVVVLGDGSLAVTNNGYAANGLMGISPDSGVLTWLLPLHAAWLGLARAGDTLWASGGKTNRVYRLVPNGPAWTSDSIVLADTMTRLFTGGISVAPGRGLVAAVGNLNDSVYLIDAATMQRRGAFPVGHKPYTVVADSNRLYVSNWGDSTVSVIDLTAASPDRPTALFVGPHPSALALRGRELFVALAGANGVARIDLATGRVLEQLTVALGPRAPVGSDPNALALAPDGRTLYVAMAGNNAVAVVRLSARAMHVAGLIPVGWYPTAVAVAGDGRTLYVANGKGQGSAANPDRKYIGNVITGSVSIIPVPDSAGLARYTRQVYALSPYTNPRVRPTVRPSVRPAIHHVVYVIRENRTYDQVFGDVAAGNGDAALAIFNDSVTPNAHALARRWVLCDNFYVDGEVSADGHQWSTRAFAGDYNEKTWPAIYGNRRAYDLEDGEDVESPRDAYLWDAARRKGLWIVNFGEFTEADSTHRYDSKISGLKGITATNYPGWNLAVADTTRARLFADSVDSWDRQGTCRVITPRDAAPADSRRARWWPTTTSPSAAWWRGCRGPRHGAPWRCSRSRTTRRTVPTMWTRTARCWSSRRRGRAAAWWTARSTRRAQSCAPSVCCWGSARSVSTTLPPRRCGTPSPHDPT